MDQPELLTEAVGNVTNFGLMSRILLQKRYAESQIDTLGRTIYRFNTSAPMPTPTLIYYCQADELCCRFQTMDDIAKYVGLLSPHQVLTNRKVTRFDGIMASEEVALVLLQFFETFTYRQYLHETSAADLKEATYKIVKKLNKNDRLAMLELLALAGYYFPAQSLWVKIDGWSVETAGIRILPLYLINMLIYNIVEAKADRLQLIYSYQTSVRMKPNEIAPDPFIETPDDGSAGKKLWHFQAVKL